MPRFQATALADNDDNLWVFGGSQIDRDKFGMEITFLIGKENFVNKKNDFLFN